MILEKEVKKQNWMVEDRSNSNQYLFGPYNVKTPEEALLQYFKDEMIEESQQPDKYTVYQLEKPIDLEVVLPPNKPVIKRI